MKIIVLSDLHIPTVADDLPIEVYTALSEGVDMIILAGDIVETPMFERLKNICPNIRAVSGNMDSAALKKQLPEKEIICVQQYKIGIMHGYGPPDKLLGIVEKIFKNDKVDIVIFGHSHSALNQKKNGVLYFNPGSPTDKIFAPFNSFGIIEINGGIKAQIVKL